MPKLLDEFKQFAMRGNVVDLAVGVVIGAAFGKIVTSLVNDILMPPLGWLVGNMDFSNLKWVIHQGVDAAHTVSINYGLFINAVLNFMIVAFAIFMLVKAINHLHKKEAPAAPAVTTKACPECASNIPLAAKRCPHCTSTLAE